jgi:hypothetical protein
MSNEKPKETQKDSIKIDPSKVIKTQPKLVKESFSKQEKLGDSAKTKKI